MWVSPRGRVRLSPLTESAVRRHRRFDRAIVKKTTPCRIRRRHARRPEAERPSVADASPIRLAFAVTNQEIRATVRARAPASRTRVRSLSRERAVLRGRRRRLRERHADFRRENPQAQRSAPSPRPSSCARTSTTARPTRPALLPCGLLAIRASQKAARAATRTSPAAAASPTARARLRARPCVQGSASTRERPLS